MSQQQKKSRNKPLWKVYANGMVVLRETGKTVCFLPSELVDDAYQMRCFEQQKFLRDYFSRK